ncbi:MAG: hypothetical protein IKX30_10020 [Victivallales bacterium]|nr:hypothetical protein [Victivallales bacterium]
MKSSKGKTSNGCLRLGGSSRFAQVQTTSCESSYFMVCWLGGLNALRATDGRYIEKH